MLLYYTEEMQMANTINTRIVLRNGTAAEWEAVKDSVEKALLVGEMGVETDTGLFKLGKKHDTEDRLCTWAELEYANDVPDLTGVTNSVKESATLEGLGDGAVVGDVGIVKAPLYEGAEEFTYTGYVWNGTAWAAMDGNYSAANVFLPQSITLAGDYGQIYDTADKKYYDITSLGNYRKGDVIDAGTSVGDIFKKLFTKTLQPSKSAPTATISATGDDGGKETGDTYTKPTGTITVTAGSYTNEGTATGVTYAIGNVVIAYGADPEADKATYRNTNADVLGHNGTVTMPASKYASGATTANYTDDSVSYTFSGMAHNEAGNVAKDNLGGNSNPVVQIGAGDLTVADKTVSFRGHRKMFCGCTSDTLNSATIRGLSLKSAKAAKGTFEVTAPTGATQIVLALPTKSVGKRYTMTKAEMYTSNWEDYTSLFSSAQTIQVADKRGGENGLQNYNVYTYSFAALKANTRFQFTVAEANV
jgi:hypothetical protein